MRQVAIGIAGTAKNTGKTTTLTALSQALACEKGLRVALTSIGYDGESFDNVTGLPKPRITAWEGMYAAVARRCLAFSRAQVEVLQDTGVQTPMGSVLIGRVTKPGKLIVAGPNKRSDLRTVLDCLETHGVHLCVVDGAFGRILPFAETDGVILATGASRFPDIGRLAADTGAILSILGTPLLDSGGETLDAESLLSDAAYAAFRPQMRDARTIRFAGVVAQKYLAAMAGEPGIAGRCILFADPLKLLVAGMPEQTRESLEALRQAGAEVGVGRQVRVLGLTVNPYYPRYRISRQDYEPAYVDPDMLLSALGACSPVPCFDVVRQGVSALTGGVLSLLGSRAE